jgi:hypothetical protein
MCLDALLHGSVDTPVEVRQGLERPGIIPALGLATEVRRVAEGRIAANHAATMLGDLALDALPPAVTEALGPGEAWADLSPEATLSRFSRWSEERRLHQLSNHFLARDLEQVFKYFVSRDVNDYVGTPSLPTVGDSRRLVEEVGLLCRERGAGLMAPSAEPTLQEIMRLSPGERATELEPLMGEGIRDGLDNLSDE